MRFSFDSCKITCDFCICGNNVRFVIFVFLLFVCCNKLWFLNWSISVNTLFWDLIHCDFHLTVVKSHVKFIMMNLNEYLNFLFLYNTLWISFDLDKISCNIYKYRLMGNSVHILVFYTLWFSLDRSKVIFYAYNE